MTDRSYCIITKQILPLIEFHPTFRMHCTVIFSFAVTVFLTTSPLSHTHTHTLRGAGQD